MSEAVHRVGAVTGGFFSCSFGRKRLGGGGNERGDETRRTCNPWRSRYRVRERVSTLSSLVVLRISSVKPDPPTHTHSNHYQSLCFLLPFFFFSFYFIFFRNETYSCEQGPTRTYARYPRPRKIPSQHKPINPT